MEMPLDEIRFILETADLNRKAAEASLKGNFGHTVSKTVSGVYGRKYMGDSGCRLRRPYGWRHDPGDE